MAALAGTDVTAVSDAVKIYYSKKFGEILQESLYYHQVADKEKASLAMGDGGTIEYTRWLKIPTPSSGLTEGTAPSSARQMYNQIIQATVTEWGDWTDISSKYKFQNIDPKLTQMQAIFANQAARSIDEQSMKESAHNGSIPMRVDNHDTYERHNVQFTTVTSTSAVAATGLTEDAGVWTGGKIALTSPYYKGYGEGRMVTTGAASGALTLASALNNLPSTSGKFSIAVPTGLDETDVITLPALKRAVKKLRQNLAPTYKDGYFVAVFNPETQDDITNDSRWEILQTRHASGPKGIFKGEFGEAYGIKAVMTDQLYRCAVDAPATYDADGAIHMVTVFGMHSLGVVEAKGQGLHTIISPPERAEPKLEMFSTMGWKAMYGPKALNSVCAAGIWCGATP